MHDKNILDLADEFESTLNDGDYDFEDSALMELFEDILEDYKTVVDTCDVDVGDDNIKQFNEILEGGSVAEKEEAIEDLKERIISIVEEAGSDAPEDITNKYCKDLVDIMEDGDYYVDDDEED